MNSPNIIVLQYTIDKNRIFREYASMSIAREYFEKLLDIVFPKQVRVLELEQKARNDTLGSLPEAPETPLSYATALFSYKDHRVRELVWQIKYKQNYILTSAAAKLLFEFILDDLQDVYFFENHKKVLIIPVPASKERVRERGANQAERLVHEILKHDSDGALEHGGEVILKIKNTISQTKTRSKSERMKNPIGAFAVVKPEEVRGRNIIVIDDVITTGSTIKELAKVLKGAGAKSVKAYTIAH